MKISVFKVKFSCSTCMNEYGDTLMTIVTLAIIAYKITLLGDIRTILVFCKNVEDKTKLTAST